jgi:hypothetical protein
MEPVDSAVQQHLRQRVVYRGVLVQGAGVTRRRTTLTILVGGLSPTRNWQSNEAE